MIILLFAAAALADVVHNYDPELNYRLKNDTTDFPFDDPRDLYTCRGS